LAACEPFWERDAGETATELRQPAAKINTMAGCDAVDAAAATLNIMRVRIPDGLGEGETFQFRTQQGQVMSLQVPAGLKGGSEMQFNMPLFPVAPTTEQMGHLTHSSTECRKSDQNDGVHDWYYILPFGLQVCFCPGQCFEFCPPGIEFEDFFFPTLFGICGTYGKRCRLCGRKVEFGPCADGEETLNGTAV